VISHSQLRGLDEPAREAVSAALLKLGLTTVLSEGLRQAEQIKLVLVRARRPPATKPAELVVEGVTSEQAFPCNVIDINTRRRGSSAATTTASE
jgi:hypothetical protein